MSTQTFKHDSLLFAKPKNVYKSIAEWKNLLKSVCACVFDVKISTLFLEHGVVVQRVYQCVCLHDSLTSARCSDPLRAVRLWWDLFSRILPSLCLAWTREAPRVWKDSLTPLLPPHQPHSSIIFHPPAGSSHSQKLHIAPSEGSGLGGSEWGGFGCKNWGRKGKIEGWGGVSSRLMVMLAKLGQERKLGWHEGTAELYSHCWRLGHYTPEGRRKLQRRIWRLLNTNAFLCTLLGGKCVGQVATRGFYRQQNNKCSSCNSIKWAQCR